MRAKVMKRDKGLCVQCVKHGRTTAAQEVDHRVRLIDGGDNSMGNLQSLCVACHKAKSRVEQTGRDAGCDSDGMPNTPNQYW